MALEKQVILVPDYLTVREVAELIDESPIEVMKRLIANGIMAAINQQIDYDTAAIVIEEMGFEAKSASAVQAAEEAKTRAERSTQVWRKIYTNEDLSRDDGKYGITGGIGPVAMFYYKKFSVSLIYVPGIAYKELDTTGFLFTYFGFKF